MKFKSLFLSICLLFVGTLSFAATNDIVPVDEDPLTIKAANEIIKEAMANLTTEPQVKLVSVSSIAVEDAECTVTVNISVAGNGGSVSATAATCKEALQAVLDIL